MWSDVNSAYSFYVYQSGHDWGNDDISECGVYTFLDLCNEVIKFNVEQLLSVFFSSPSLSVVGLLTSSDTCSGSETQNKMSYFIYRSINTLVLKKITCNTMCII